MTTRRRVSGTSSHASRTATPRFGSSLAHRDENRHQSSSAPLVGHASPATGWTNAELPLIAAQGEALGYRNVLRCSFEQSLAGAAARPPEAVPQRHHPSKVTKEVR